ncbi:Rrf2 family transcriptional regulator [Fervidibacillus halotolerans]|uniref:Rrf2 family transcriptional regulator n=1 Tax=Fervidibacillus halotolerans TaxID=2980027 RepID=A0A9E8RYR9_9BACI|nr:Rrf2 family transcriptional regulator [Fervidibacillus halotolerans]WAA12464.1 Rrf2 family transcriptional regulator [Fervidibacillus halotolerans]
MSISSRFAVGIHILTFIELNKGKVSSSDYIAKSVNTNPALIRKMMGMLKRAGLIEVHPGIAGAKLAKKPSEITLLDVYKAVNVVRENQLFRIHEHPNPNCPVGRNIQHSIEPIFAAAQLEMENFLKKITLENIVEDIAKKEEIG